ncbi:thioredoxin family protein [Macrococcus equipercicus]|uniref:Thioredoxin family protein n=1 Tax=Macrococcus equipercicus TaxID=69967 RepID=A0A9Q9BVL9_9STAP|nr:thioredoxin family protein [Macrococcus equipercicus]KAA1038406.1 thioredoxin family protein [Macrococcus equipercicus]UTH13207.1 thioredoxin family protein [Macrococcus equipercicus]
MINLTNEQDFNELINKPTIVMFTAGWCPDCHFIQPALPEIEAVHDDYQFVSVDRDAFMDLAVQYDVMGIPSFVAFNEGRETGRFVSRDRKTKEEINQFIESL